MASRRAVEQLNDVWQYQRWCQPFVWLGMNSILTYVAANILNFPCDRRQAWLQIKNGGFVFRGSLD